MTRRRSSHRYRVGVSVSDFFRRAFRARPRRAGRCTTTCFAAAGCDETDDPALAVRVLRDEDAAVEGGFSIVQDDPSWHRSFCATPVAVELRGAAQALLVARRGGPVVCSSSPNISRARWSLRPRSAPPRRRFPRQLPADPIRTQFPPNPSFDVSELAPEHVHAAAKLLATQWPATGFVPLDFQRSTQICVAAVATHFRATWCS